MRAVFRILLLTHFLTIGGQPSNGQTPVAIELVLAVDTSLSVNNAEFDLQMKGIANAFRSEEIINLIGLYDGVAVSLIQWGGWVSEEHTVPWRLLKSEQSIRDFADEVEKTERENVGYFTAIGTAVNAAIKSLLENQYAGRLLKIDVSGDGANNAGPLPLQSRVIAEQVGISINGLAIRTDVPDLDDYFRRELISGPGAFVISISDYQNFGRAMQRKLKKELAPPISWRDERFRKASRVLLPAALPQSSRLARRSTDPSY